jgi:uncharacterized membrane protein YhaH (DUF805 family)
MPLVRALFSLNGRIGRLHYLLYNIMVEFAWFIANALGQRAIGHGHVTIAGLIVGGILILGFGAGMVWADTALIVKRLHDVNISSCWTMLIVAVPIVIGIASHAAHIGSALVVNLELGLLLLLALIPGTKGPNKYGAPTHLKDRNREVVLTGSRKKQKRHEKVSRLGLSVFIAVFVLGASRSPVVHNLLTGVVIVSAILFAAMLVLLLFLKTKSRSKSIR